MHTALTKKTWFGWGLYAVLSFLFLGLLFAQEFLITKKSDVALFATSFAAVSAWLVVATLLSKTQKQKLQRYTRLALVVGLCMVALHFVVNVIDIYHLGTLPSWFYSFKLYRFVSLSGLFLVQILIFIWGTTIAARLQKTTNPFATASLSLIALFIAVITLAQLQKAVATLYDQSVQMSINAHIPFADRFTYKQGGTVYYGWIWPYSQFIIKHTPSDAVLMLPPQSNVWKMEGNSDYFRWFMYPRTLVHAVGGVIPVGTTHVLIALGECGEGDCGWPIITIPAERIKQIILIDRESQAETTLTNTEYHLDIDRYQWGIIELQPL